MTEDCKSAWQKNSLKNKVLVLHSRLYGGLHQPEVSELYTTWTVPMCRDLIYPRERSRTKRVGSLDRRALLGLEGRGCRDVQVDGAARRSPLEHQVGVELGLRVELPRRSPPQAVLTPDRRGRERNRMPKTLVVIMGWWKVGEELADRTSASM